MIQHQCLSHVCAFLVALAPDRQSRSCLVLFRYLYDAWTTSQHGVSEPHRYLRIIFEQIFRISSTIEKA